MVRRGCRAGRNPALAVLIALFLSVQAFAADTAHNAPEPPSIEFGDLYRAVEMVQIFPDQKTFADAVPKEPPSQILADYEARKGQPGFDLKTFVARHFVQPERKTVDYKPRPDRSVADYIASMWDVLKRDPDKPEPYSSLLPLDHPYVVPGGRFSEIYYWDTFFTMLGMEQDGRHDLAVDMVENLASLIDRYGHVPNGNRSYYLSRSEPPFFSCMVELIAARDGDGVLRKYLPEMQAEYDYWMDGADRIAPGSAYRHVVRLADGSVLNRYWDDRAEPRDESYREDVETASHGARPKAEIYRDLRAGAETGWDFSSRWLADGAHLWTIRTTSIAPVDLNSLLVHLEQALAKAYRAKGDAAKAQLYEKKAKMRSALIRRLMWNPDAGLFVDYLWRERRQSLALSAATVFPLYFGVATPEQAHRVGRSLRPFLKPGGVETTLTETGQQWDRPNGWAPLQYLAIEGLNAYGERDLAREIARDWMAENIEAYEASGVLVEKYDVEQPPGRRGRAGGSGGEYPLQVGFGWTNGVLAKLMAQYPDETQKILQRHPMAK